MNWDTFRQWALEDKALQGLGGPPNNWQRSPEYPTRQHGMSTSHKWWAIRFDNDGFDVHILTQYDDGDRSLCLMMAGEDFRKLALWYLWRWAWGEWFGLRRWLYYRDLSHRLKGHFNK